MTKCLEQGTFCWPRSVEPGATRMSLAPEAFALLTDGIDMHAAKKSIFAAFCRGVDLARALLENERMLTPLEARRTT